jgi:hypothetical protein
MEYSAVTQPRPCPRNHAGSRSSTEAAHNTWVSPRRIDADPSAYGIVFAMIWSGRS